MSISYMKPPKELLDEHLEFLDALKIEYKRLSLVNAVIKLNEAFNTEDSSPPEWMMRVVLYWDEQQRKRKKANEQRS